MGLQYLKLPTHHHEPTTPKKSDALTFSVHSCFVLMMTIQLHMLVTDVIEGQGGSATLIKILNQLGVCSSADTLSRYILNRTSNPQTRMDQCLNQDGFTIVSTDNIDFLHSYARVYKGSQNSGWHGVSVQAVQPLPSLSIQSEATSMDQIESHISHQTHTSPPCQYPIACHTQA